MLKIENLQLKKFKEQQTRERVLKSRFSLPKDSSGSSRGKLRSSQDRQSRLSQAMNGSENYPNDTNSRSKVVNQRSHSAIGQAVLKSVGNQVSSTKPFPATDSRKKSIGSI